MSAMEMCPSCRRQAAYTVPALPKDDFCVFFEVLRVRDQSQSLLQALTSNFLSKMSDWMRMCRVMPVFVVLARFTVPALPKDELRKP